VALMEGPDVLVGGGARRPAPHGAQHQLGGCDAEHGRQREHGQVLAQDPLEHDVERQRLERGHHQRHDHAGGCRRGQQARVAGLAEGPSERPHPSVLPL